MGVGSRGQSVKRYMFVIVLTFNWKKLICLVAMAFFIVGIFLVIGEIKVQINNKIISR